MINIYQVLPRLYTNRQGENIPNGTIYENGCGKLNYFTSKVLKCIAKSGYTHIWYTGVIEHATKTDYSEYNISPDHVGVVKGQAGSPYAIKDYYDIDPDLAVDIPNRMAEFEALVERTHKAHLKVIIDFVPNHVARSYHSDAKPKRVKDFGQTDNVDWAFSQQNNFYYLPNQYFSPQFDVKGYEEFPAKATGNDQFSAYPTTNDWYETVKLNYGVDYCGGKIGYFEPIPDTWNKMRDILLFWAKKGVDGFRCDMAEMVPVEFWGWVIPQIKKKFKEIIFIAEVYNPNEYRNYIFNGQFDFLYDKVGLYDTLRAVTRHEASASQITSCWQSIDDIKSHMLNFLENHDEQRIASSFFIGDAWKSIPALVVSATLHSSPFMVYAGQELGESGMDEEGFSGRDGRTTIFDYWKVDTLSRQYNDGDFSDDLLSDDEIALRNVYKKILQLRLKEDALQNDASLYDLTWLNFNNSQFDTNKQFAYLRQNGEQTLLIVVNFADYPVELGINISAHALQYLNFPLEKMTKVKDLLTGERFKQLLSAESPFAVSVEPRNARILELK